MKGMIYLCFALGIITAALSTAASSQDNYEDAVAAPPALHCMMCDAAASLAQCDGLELCHPYQVCFVEEEYVLDDIFLVHAGCRNRTDCDSIGCFGEDVSKEIRNVTSAWKVDGRRLKCHHCCDTEYCNMYGCPDKYDVSTLTGSRCLSCADVSSPEECQTIVNCEPHQECFMTKMSPGGSVRYELGCERKAMCEMLALVKNNRRRKRSEKFASECCTEHLCNRHDPLAEKAPSPYSKDYTCPHPTTTSTTTTTTTTTTTPIATTPTTTPTTTPVTFETLPPDQCWDRLKCDVYDKTIACEGRWASWGHKNCPVFCGYCPELVTTTPVPETTTEVVCEDLIDCSMYGRGYACSESYEPWARVNCALYCGYCTVPKTEPQSVLTTTQTPCEDKLDCSRYDENVACVGMYIHWGKENCPRYCGLCTDVKETVPGCVDKLDNCQAYGKGICDVPYYRMWAAENCRLFCDVCYVTTPPPTTIPSTTKAPPVTSMTTTTTTTTPTTTNPTTTNPTTTTSTTTNPTTLSPTSTSPTTTMRCEDQLTNCPDMAKDICLFEEMRYMCRKTCNSCP